MPADVKVCFGCLNREDDEHSRMGNYAVEELIGRGGMGEVYRARDLRLGRHVALKFLPEALCADPEGRARFEREARALASLSHPNIVTLYEFGELEGQPYLAMELVDGPSPSSRVPSARPEALRIVREVCSALSYAHRRGVIHRDVKPENVLVAFDGRVKLTDFGIARLKNPKTQRGWTVTSTNQVMGTPQFMAPEALEGAAPDPRMDVFSVGVLLYQLLTGKLPVGAFDPLEPSLDRILRRALAPDPAQRFESIDELDRALEELMGREHHVHASSGTPPYPTTNPHRSPAPSPSHAPFGNAHALPQDEQTWIRAVALVQAVAAALVFFAALSMLTPRVVAKEDLLPLVALAPERLDDGRIVTRARFETFPTLIAALGVAAAVVAYGVLQRHWRRSGLFIHAPDERIPHAWWLLAAGVVTCLLYATRRFLEETGAIGPTLYMPVLGGVFELWVVYITFTVLLEARRRSRPLAREPLMWMGCVLAVIPPIIEFFSYLEHWRP